VNDERSKGPFDKSRNPMSAYSVEKVDQSGGAALRRVMRQRNTFLKEGVRFSTTINHGQALPVARQCGRPKKVTPSQMPHRPQPKNKPRATTVARGQGTYHKGF
jgi:hypothetical protein